jgi:hypothetical protein
MIKYHFAVCCMISNKDRHLQLTQVQSFAPFLQILDPELVKGAKLCKCELLARLKSPSSFMLPIWFLVNPYLPLVFRWFAFLKQSNSR